MKAVGIHVFAGGFTGGVQQRIDVECQLETHGFGLETAEKVFNCPTINCEAKDWPNIKCDFVYGNPRCTGFSSITCGYDETSHGPWSKPTQDIHDLCNWSVKNDVPIIVWESVQQAYTVGRPLLDHLRDNLFVPNGYRLAHVFLNAATFGNSQHRRRYFFVAYKGDNNFNIVPPCPSKPVMLYDVIGNGVKGEAVKHSTIDYHRDSYMDLSPAEWAAVPILPNDFDLNKMAQYGLGLLPPKFQNTWNTRLSDMPFSMHGIVRLNYLRPAPTLHSSACRFIHPYRHRPLTVGELSDIMGWPDIPVGPKPIPQIVKGVVPELGKWLAEQAIMYLNNEWGDEDWESSYEPKQQMWIGGDCNGAVEKTFDLTKLYNRYADLTKYPKLKAWRLVNGKIISAPVFAG